MAGARIGRHCSLGQNVFMGGDAVIGDHVKIQNNVSTYDGVVLEEDFSCSGVQGCVGARRSWASTGMGR